MEKKRIPAPTQRDLEIVERKQRLARESLLAPAKPPLSPALAASSAPAPSPALAPSPSRAPSPSPSRAPASALLPSPAPSLPAPALAAPALAAAPAPAPAQPFAPSPSPTLVPAPALAVAPAPALMPSPAPAISRARPFAPQLPTPAPAPAPAPILSRARPFAPALSAPATFMRPPVHFPPAPTVPLFTAATVAPMDVYPQPVRRPRINRQRARAAPQAGGPPEHTAAGKKSKVKQPRKEKRATPPAPASHPPAPVSPPPAPSSPPREPLPAPASTPSTLLEHALGLGYGPTRNDLLPPVEDGWDNFSSYGTDLASAASMTIHNAEHLRRISEGF